MDKAGKLVIISSVVGIAILYSLSLLLNPPLVPLDEVASHEGAVIRTRGVVTSFSLTGSGNVVLRLEGNGTELRIYLTSKVYRSPEMLNLSYGDEVEVEGTVELYQGEYELVVPGNGLKKLSSGGTIWFVAQIANDPERYRGRKIQVAGYVEEIYQRVFYLRDETSTYHLRVNLVKAGMPTSGLQEGAQIIVEGVLAYDAKTMRYELNLVGWRDAP